MLRPKPADVLYVSTLPWTSGATCPDIALLGVGDRLKVLIRHFDRDSLGSAKWLRELLANDREAFYNGALATLTNLDESRGWQFLITLLAEGGLLVRALCEPTLSMEQARRTVRAANQACLMVDVAIARHLTELNDGDEDASHQAVNNRLMDLLAENSDGGRIIPALMTLSRQPNPYLQSKAVLMIGRINRNVKWVQDRMASADARIRANAIEALWGVDSKEARQLLRAAARDPDNRVVGNALIALYRLGDPWTIPELLKMASHESRRFRQTASWIMGQTGDPRFTRTLAGLIGDPNLTLRTRAFAALGQIKAAAGRARETAEWRVTGHALSNRRSRWRDLRVGVCSPDGGELSGILPTHFALSEDGLNVVNYTVEERPVPGAYAVTFLFPRKDDPSGPRFREGVLKGLEWKRPSDLWAVVPYLPAVGLDGRPLVSEDDSDLAETAVLPDDVPIQFSCDRKTVAAALRKIPPRAECADLWGALRRSVQTDARPARGQLQLVVFGRTEVAMPPENDETESYAALASTIVAARARLHAISLVPNHILAGLSQLTHGTFQLVEDVKDVSHVVEDTCLQMLARYQIRYQPVSPAATEALVRVQCPLGSGEARIAMRGDGPVT